MKFFNDKKLFWLLWFLFGAVFIILNFKHPLNSDEGVILGGAWRLWNGEDLYLDFFEYIPPGSFYYIWGAWKIFGPFYWVARLASMVLVFLGGIGLYKICSRPLKIKENLWCFLPVFLFLISVSFHPLVNHNTLSLVFVIWGIYFFLQGLENHRKVFFASSGLFTGVSLLFLQHRGGALVVAGMSFLLWWIIKKQNRNFVYLGYYAGFFLLPLVFLLKWPLQLIFDNLIIFPLSNYHDVNQISLFYFLIFLFLFLLLVWSGRKKMSVTQKFLAWSYFLLLLSLLSRPDFGHLSLVFPIFGVLVVSFLDQIDSYNGVTRTVIKGEFCFLLLMLASFCLVMFSIGYSSRDKEVFSFVENNCKKEHIYAGPFLPGFYFEVKKFNPGFYPSLLILNKQPKKLEQVKKTLESYRPDCAILNYDMVKKFQYDRDNPVDNWLKKEYKKVFQDEGIMVFKIKE